MKPVRAQASANYRKEFGGLLGMKLGMARDRPSPYKDKVWRTIRDETHEVEFELRRIRSPAAEKLGVEKLYEDRSCL